MVKKILLTFLSFITLFTSSMFYFAAPKAYAQDTNPWYFQSYPQWFTKVYDEKVSPPQEIFGERYTAAQVQWVIYSLISFVTYPIKEVGTCIAKTLNVPLCLAENPLFPIADASSTQPEKGVFATIFDENRPISGVNYVRQKLSSLHLIPQAEAQTGFGFNALNPIQNIWRAFRDIMYGMFVIIIIVYAFMIMFRVKLNPQTVVSVQSALPKIIITLILVTFSYAIAGLLIDLTYVVIGLIALILGSSGILSGTWLDIFKLLTEGPGNPATGMLYWFAIFTLPLLTLVFAFSVDIGATIGGAGGVVVASFVAVLSFLAFLGIVLWLILTIGRVFLLLIRTYLNIFISIIFSPILIGFGAVSPAGGFGSWLKGLVSNLAIYPVMGLFFVLASVFLGGSYPAIKTAIDKGISPVTTGNIFNTTNNKEFWYPPLTLGTQKGTWDPLPFLWALSSLAILAMIPNVANIIKGIMSGKGAETGIGQAFGEIYGMAQVPTANLGSIKQRNLSLRAATTEEAYKLSPTKDNLRRWKRAVYNQQAYAQGPWATFKKQAKF